MALELPAGRRSMSPESSGRDSPAPRQWRNQLGADEPRSKDKSYRKYASGIDRALSLFETALQEWADYISFLNRLLKALQARQPHITAIPAKTLVAKRLSQCLNPSLPSGVHQKALEVYNVVFSIIGKDGLSLDLPLYLPGLAPTLSFASLKVRGHFLDLFERHFLDLNPRSLRPALKALILALLPGLEEETAEDFDRTLKLLNCFKAAVRPPGSEDLTPDHSTGDDFFWQCFFLASITSHSRRPGALAYLSRFLPKLGPSQPAGHQQSATASTASTADDAADVLTAKLSQLVASPEPGLLLRCLAAGLSDEQLLIQRGYLDLLVGHLPLHASVVQKRVQPADLELLMRAACGVVTRREMSLNRRLTAWLLGPDPPAAPAGFADAAGGAPLESPASPGSAADRQHSGLVPSHRTAYFEEYGLQPLTRAILSMVAVGPGSGSAERARPYRICLSLMDRWEIGGLVVPEVFLPIVDSVRRYKEAAPSKADFSEVLRSASFFFDGVESGLIYGEMLSLVVLAIGPGGQLSPAERADKLALVRFILTHFNVREEEMITVHAPLSALSILCMLEDTAARAAAAGKGQPGEAADDASTQVLSIALDLLELAPERAFSAADATSLLSSLRAQADVSNAELLKNIRHFYVDEQGSLDTAAAPYSPQVVAQLLLQKASNVTCKSLVDRTAGDSLALKSRLLMLLLDKIPAKTPFDVSLLLAALQSRLSFTTASSPLRRSPSFATFSSCVSLAMQLQLSERISTAELVTLVPAIVGFAWGFLAASEPKYHVETVRSLWSLQTALGAENREIEAAISQLVIQDDVRGAFAVRSADAGRRFGVLWLHSLQDNPNGADRRTPRTPKTPNGGLTSQRWLARLAGMDHYQVMLTRPLLLVLDALLDDRTQLFMTVKAWLSSLVGIDKLFLILLSKFFSLDMLRSSAAAEWTGDHAGYASAPLTEDDDVDMCLYYLRTLSNVLRWMPDLAWAVLARRTVSADDLGVGVNLGGEVPLQDFFLRIGMKCVVACTSSVVGSNGGGEAVDTVHTAQLCRYALTVLHQILLSRHAVLLSRLHLEDVLLEQLQRSLQGPDPYIQVLLLDVLYAALRLREASSVTEPALSPSLLISEKRALSMDAAAKLAPTLLPPLAEDKISFMGSSSAGANNAGSTAHAIAMIATGNANKNSSSSSGNNIGGSGGSSSNNISSNSNSNKLNSSGGDAGHGSEGGGPGASGLGSAAPPAALLKCIQAGLSARSSRVVLDSWVGFLKECLPLYSDSIFQVLIPLVETLCAQIGGAFAELQDMFRAKGGWQRSADSGVDPEAASTSNAPETTLISLLNALEQLLATSHQRLLAEEARAQAAKGPDQPQSFFGNMNIFATDALTTQTRSATANDRLTVLLAFQDAVRICFTIWSWGKGSGGGGGGEPATGTGGPAGAGAAAQQDPTSAASFNYTSLRMRNRARRLLEHLFAAETLECLETVIDLWRRGLQTSSSNSADVLDLLPTLDGSRPKQTIPAIFNAIYSRTNPAALDAARRSTLTIALQDTDIVVFLVDYARSLEDDAMDEIWQDCTVFLKDLLTNPFPHRQSLPCLLEFAAILGEKVDNTNFGEQRKMRRDLGDLFLRLLTALFTTRPVVFSDVSAAAGSTPEKENAAGPGQLAAPSSSLTPAAATAAATTASAPSAWTDTRTPAERADDVVGILSAMVPNLPKILTENDRVLTAAGAISTNVIGPTLRAKAFPDTVSRGTLALLQGLSRLPNNQKGWKKDVADAFNDARFFSSPLALVRSDWLGLLRQWSVADKDRMPELVARITPPTTAGIVFGVGATSARLDADRRTQLNLRRVGLLILAAAPDAFVTDLRAIADRLVELLAASPTSSPSSTTRAEVFLVMRALVLRTSAVHLAALWPVIDAELHAAIAAIVAPDNSAAADTYNNAALLQACKLLDLLVCVAPDDFQLREWLFVTDTIEAVYRSANYQPVALADELSEELGAVLASAGAGHAAAAAEWLATPTTATAGGGANAASKRRPLLGSGGNSPGNSNSHCISDDVSLDRKDELVSKVLRPFFNQLSIFAFESTYAMGAVDVESCFQGVLKDLFDERAIVKAL